MKEKIETPLQKKIIGTERLWLRFGLLFVFVIFLISIILEIISIAKFGRVIDSVAMLLLFYTSLFFTFLIIFGIPSFILGMAVGLIVEWLNR